MLFVRRQPLLAPVLVAMAEFAVAYGLCEKQPVISDLLIAHGLSQLTETIVYGLYNFPAYRGDTSERFSQALGPGGASPDSHRPGDCLAAGRRLRVVVFVPAIDNVIHRFRERARARARKPWRR